MYRSRRKKTFERVLVDMATQRDFLVSNAPMAVLNREEITANIRSLMGWARAKRMTVMSCIQAYRPSDDQNGHPRHCIDGTPGQKKMPFTLLPKRAIVEADNSLSVPLGMTSQHNQVIFRKRTNDLLANPKADRFINEAKPDQFVLFGVGLETWIRILPLGMMVRKKPVAVVSDACGYWDPVAADLALRQLEAKGIAILKTEDLIAHEPATPMRRTQPIVQKLHETPRTD